MERQSGGHEGLAGSMENEQPFAARGVSQPETAVGAHQEGFREMAVQPVFRLAVPETEDTLSPGGDPDVAVPVLRKGRDLGTGQEGLLHDVVPDIPVQTAVRADP